VTVYTTTTTYPSELATDPVDGGVARPQGDTSRYALWMSAVALTAVPFLLDMLTISVNLAILYFVPLCIVARARRVKPLVIGCAALVTLTYGSYVYELVWLGHERVFSYRIVNRTLVSIGLVAVTAVIVWWIRWRDDVLVRPKVTWHADANQAVYDEVIAVIERVGIGAVCALYVGIVAIGDLISPGQYNLPILYSITVVLAGMTRSRPFLWALAACLFVLIPVGYYFGAPVTLAPSFLTFVLTNRILAAVMVLSLVVFVHIWIGRSAPVVTSDDVRT
jgi:hypothetical protein